MAVERRMQFYMTSGIAADMESDGMFAAQVASAIHRFTENDWGVMDGEDFEVNVNAMQNGGRVMGVYPTKRGRIWIINDDAHAEEMTVTVLYPSEY